MPLLEYNGLYQLRHELAAYRFAWTRQNLEGLWHVVVATEVVAYRYGDADQGEILSTHKTYDEAQAARDVFDKLTHAARRMAS